MVSPSQQFADDPYAGDLRLTVLALSGPCSWWRGQQTRAVRRNAGRRVSWLRLRRRRRFSSRPPVRYNATTTVIRCRPLITCYADAAPGAVAGPVQSGVTGIDVVESVADAGMVHMGCAAPWRSSAPGSAGLVAFQRQAQQGQGVGGGTSDVIMSANGSARFWQPLPVKADPLLVGSSTSLSTSVM